MRGVKSLLRERAVKLGTMMQGAAAKRIACVTAVACGLALANFGLGDDKQGSTKPATATAAAAQKTTVSDPTGPARTDRPVSEGHVRHHGALGVLLTAADDGVIVVGVIAGSPAERAGLRSGDEIRFVDDQQIQTIPELTDTIAGHKPGARVDLLVRRNGRRQVMEAILAAQESTVAGGDEPGRSSGPAAAREQQPGAGRKVTPNSSAPTAAQLRERQLSQRMRDLERQIYRMQQQLNDVRYTQSTHAANVHDLSDWWERQHHGQADDDPALFQ